MKKTTVYLTEELDVALKRASARHRLSEAEIIRKAVRGFLDSMPPPRPRLPLFRSGDPTPANRFDEELRGFGE